MNEKTIVKKLKRRDEEAFLLVIEQYSKLLWIIAANILSSNPEDIEECVSDVFIGLWNHPEKYDPHRGGLKTYLCIQARSRALNMKEKYQKVPVVYLEDYQGDVFIDSTNGEIEILLQQENYDILYEALAYLKEPTKEIIIRRYFFDEKPKQIAEKLSINVKEVENRLYRGKKFLLDKLKNSKEALLP